jgi:hypothetical protein
MPPTLFRPPRKLLRLYLLCPRRPAAATDKGARSQAVAVKEEIRAAAFASPCRLSMSLVFIPAQA